jgi:DNA excision repair protein ERCC-3
MQCHASPSHDIDSFWALRHGGNWCHARSYQREALAAIPREGRSIAVLPCGAGKTMVGAVAASRLRAPNGGAPNILLVTYNREAVTQYAKNLMDNLVIAPFEVFEYTGDVSARRRGMSLTCGWKLTHFYMLTQGSNMKLSQESVNYQEYLLNTKWDAVVVDEAHLAPATHFGTAIRQLASNTRCMISLTATYVRSGAERDMDQLFGFLGTVVYRVRWTQLEKEAYIAKLHFMQVACELTPQWKETWNACVSQDRLNVQMLPPSKLESMVNIVRAHQEHGEIGLIYADGLMVVQQAVRVLREELRQEWHAVVGDTPSAERERLFRLLNEGALPGLFFSRVGEAATDFRNHRIRYVITVCSAGSSETQFAQRAGRVSRTQDVHSDGETEDAARLRRIACQKQACVYDFYTVGTSEELWAKNRVKYLVEEGYKFKHISSNELLSCVAEPRNAYRMSGDSAVRLLRQMLRKAHDANVEREVHKALVLKKNEQKQKSGDRAKWVKNMREGIMRDRVVRFERRNKKVRRQENLEACQAERERVRDKMGEAQSLRLLTTNDE